MDTKTYSKLSGNILDASLTVHRMMGPGLPESVYEQYLMKEFQIRNIMARNQVSVPLNYKGQELLKDFRIDILVEEEIILEIKSSDYLLPVHEAQIISCLNPANKKDSL